MPKRFRRLLVCHTVRTAFESGLADVQNGRLLARAAGEFDVVITLDQRLVHQQNLSVLPIAVLVLIVPNNSWDSVRQLGSAAFRTLATIEPKTLVQLFPDGRSNVVSFTR